MPNSPFLPFICAFPSSYLHSTDNHYGLSLAHPSRSLISIKHCARGQAGVHSSFLQLRQELSSKYQKSGRLQGMWRGQKTRLDPKKGVDFNIIQ